MALAILTASKYHGFMLIPLGFLSWLIMGIAVGWLGHVFLPSADNRIIFDVLGALSGSLLGGIVATLLGFGGAAGFDLRALTFATLAAMFSFLLVRIPNRRSPPESGG